MEYNKKEKTRGPKWSRKRRWAARKHQGKNIRRVKTPSIRNAIITFQTLIISSIYKQNSISHFNCAESCIWASIAISAAAGLFSRGGSICRCCCYCVWFAESNAAQATLIKSTASSFIILTPSISLVSELNCLTWLINCARLVAGASRKRLLSKAHCGCSVKYGGEWANWAAADARFSGIEAMDTGAGCAEGIAKRPEETFGGHVKSKLSFA